MAPVWHRRLLSNERNKWAKGNQITEYQLIIITNCIAFGDIICGNSEILCNLYRVSDVLMKMYVTVVDTNGFSVLNESFPNGSIELFVIYYD